MIYKVKDIPIYYEVHGEGHPILMIHGWSPDHRLMSGCLEPVFQGRDEEWQRIYFDLPGMGQTPGVPWINGSDDMLEVVLQFIDGVIPGRHFLIAGESYGGYLTRGVIKERYDQVDGMLLICPVADQDTRLEHAPAFQVIEKDEAFLDTLMPEDRISFEMMNVVQTRRVWQKYKADVMSGVKQADNDFLEKHLSRQVKFSFEVDLLKSPFIKPSLLVMGRQDHAVGYRDQWALLENYPRASFVVLDKAGHNLQIEQESLFHALVTEWLERVRLEK